ncbi:MAG: SDR family NAD(P)-dependent oxidoreductase [Granulosicoccus sp.]
MNKALIDTLMEKSVVPSFSRLGTRIRSRLFDWQGLSSYSLAKRVVVITGATSGIGEAGAHRYASMGATLVIVARNAEKTDTLIATLKKSTGNLDIHRVIADLGSQEDTRKAAEEIASQWPVIDVLVHNAGALFNERKYADNGCDLSVELMVATPFLLTGLLLNNLQAASDKTQAQKRELPPSAARVLTMSSGGMYTEALTVKQLQMSESDYQGAKQYARAKRAQVVLNEMWASRIPAEQVVFHALHPGWVNTPGITDALPGFSRILSPLGLLRSADEGADTMIWLSADSAALAASGLFWHDRKVRAIDMMNKTRQADTQALRDELWAWCETHTQWHYSN